MVVYLLSAFVKADFLILKNMQKPEKTIKIGLLLSNYNSDDAKLGAELAVNEANNNGGVNKIQLQLVTRSMEGPWGTGSKQTVDLIFKDNVWAIIGSHDGRNAHLVEQVIAKTHVLFLSAWSTDPTLSKAFVPWYFSCVPNAVTQTKAIINEIYKNKINKIAIISDKDYDAMAEFKSFLNEIKSSGKLHTISIFYDDLDTDFKIISDKVQQSNVQGIILFGKSSNSIKLVNKLRHQNINIPYFATLSFLKNTEINNIEFSHFNNITLINAGNLTNLNFLNFQKTFQKKYHKVPSAKASYSYDATKIIIKALKLSYPNREKMQQVISKMQIEGVTGTIFFDKCGNRLGNVNVISVKNGIPVIIKK